MMKKRAIAVAMASALALTLGLSACSSGGDNPESDSGSDAGPVTLTMWAWASNIDKRVDAWNESHPDIHVKLTDPGGGAATVAKLLAAAKAGNAPDLAQAEYGNLASMVSGGVAKDITKEFDKYKDKYTPAVRKLVTFNGKVYGVPQDLGPTMLFYRADLFKKYGIEVPTTWKQFAQEARELHKKHPDVYLTNFDPKDDTVLMTMSQQAGAQWWSVDGSTWNVGIDSSKGQEVAKYWGDLVGDKVVSTMPGGAPGWTKAMDNGTILTTISGVWAPGVLAGMLDKSVGKWASARTPQWTPGDNRVGYSGGSSTMVTKDTKHPKQAAKFALWLNASDEGAKGLAEIAKFPAATAGQEALSEPPALMPDDKGFYDLARKVAKDTLPVTYGPNTSYAWTAYGDAFGKAVTDDSSFLTALKKMDAAVTDNLKSAGYDVKG